MQKRRISIDKSLQLRFFCLKPSICYVTFRTVCMSARLIWSQTDMTVWYCPWDSGLTQWVLLTSIAATAWRMTTIKYFPKTKRKKTWPECTPLFLSSDTACLWLLSSVWFIGRDESSGLFGFWSLSISFIYSIKDSTEHRMNECCPVPQLSSCLINVASKQKWLCFIQHRNSK